MCWFDDAVQIIRDQEKRAIPYKKALAMFLERAITENRVGKPGAPLITIDHCPDCKRATRRINGGDVPVSESELAAAWCDGEILDLREGTGEVKRTIPPRIRRQTDHRDRKRCSIPGCKNRGCQLHHPEGWENGHSVDQLFSVCYAHHDATHKGDIRSEAPMPTTKFSLRDGTYIGMAGDDVRADLDPGCPGFVADRDSGCDAAVLADAVEALRVMDLDQKTARAIVGAVVKLHPGRAWTIDDLVREALVSSPSRGA